MNPERILSRTKDALDKDMHGPNATSILSSLPMPWFDASSSTTTSTERNVSIKPFLRSSPVDHEGHTLPCFKRFIRINTFSIDDEDEDYIAEENSGPCDRVPFKNPEYPRQFLGFPNCGGAKSGSADGIHHDKRSPTKIQNIHEHPSLCSDDSPRKKMKFEHDSKRKDTSSTAAKSVLGLNTPSDDDLPKTKRGITVATPPGSPASNLPIITPGVTPQVVSVPTWDLDLQSIFYDEDHKDKKYQQPDKPEFNRKNTGTNNSKPNYLSRPSKQKTDEKYHSLLTGPYPLSMKPIIRILLHLDETSTERQKARKAFHVVQGCYRRHKLGEKRFRDLNGTIFEALVEELGVDLGKIFQASQSYSSPKLDTFFDKPADSSAPPSPVELAISYGVHMARMNPNLANFEDMIRDGAEEFKSMSEEELSGSWRSWVVNPTFKPN
jgi:hypothetical protein